jgi:hypothetical protein
VARQLQLSFAALVAFMVGLKVNDRGEIIGWHVDHTLVGGGEGLGAQYIEDACMTETAFTVHW